MNHAIRAPARWLVALLLGTLVGCGAQHPSVSGSVTLDGQPLAGAMVVFQNAEGPAGYGETDANGEFVLLHGNQTSGLPEGEYRVAISAYDKIPSTDPDQPPLPKLRTPPRYQDVTASGLQAKVQPGDNHVKFALKTLP